MYLLILDRIQSVWGENSHTEIIGIFDSMEKMWKAKAESKWNKIIANNSQDDWEWHFEQMEINQIL